MYTQAKAVLAQTLAEIESAGLWKHERTITSPQAAHIQSNGKEVVNFCANNYLGLSSHPRVIGAAQKALQDRGLPFDPTAVALPPRPASLQEARVGGLGVPLLRRIAAELDYQRTADGRNRLNLVLPAEDAVIG